MAEVDWFMRSMHLSSAGALARRRKLPLDGKHVNVELTKQSYPHFLDSHLTVFLILHTYVIPMEVVPVPRCARHTFTFWFISIS